MEKPRYIRGRWRGTRESDNQGAVFGNSYLDSFRKVHVHLEGVYHTPRKPLKIADDS